MVMDKRELDLDWSKLLGFDQAKPGTDVLKNAAKIGSKDCQSYRAFSAPLSAPE
jgi:hypothetical protein